jgi:hypothetical protein
MKGTVFMSMDILIKIATAVAMTVAVIFINIRHFAYKKITVIYEDQKIKQYESSNLKLCRAQIIESTLLLTAILYKYQGEVIASAVFKSFVLSITAVLAECVLAKLVSLIFRLDKKVDEFYRKFPQYENDRQNGYQTVLSLLAILNDVAIALQITYILFKSGIL